MYIPVIYVQTYPEHPADFGVVAGGAVGGEGDRLGAVLVLEPGAVSVLD